MKPLKKVGKGLKNAHTSNSKIGMGDYYGTGVRNKMARSRDVMGSVPSSKKKIKTPPKSLA